jgi:two-component system CheB/CheR fusion protein
LETTSEELQSTVEELETTNEELQSTNEELETMNEELQSTNEEMETANSELQQRGGDLKLLNTFLEAIMATLRDSVVVLDSDLRVRAWNTRSEELWGLRGAEVRGQNFLALDIGLPVERLTPLIHATLAASKGDAPEPFTLEAVNRRGRPINVRVEANRLPAADPVGQGVILVMQELGPNKSANPA